MGVLIQPSDFTGKWAVPISASDTLGEMIADKEEDYLTKLLGGNLYAYFKSLLPVGGLPTPYAFIYNPFAYDYNYAIIKSRGMKTMLLNFIWFEVMRKIKFKATNEGIVVNSPDSSRESADGDLWYYYNDGVDTYAAIQAYIKTIAPGDYTNATIINGSPIAFNGQSLQRTIPLFGL